MKICFLAPANNHHTKKWCEYFMNNGYIVDVISFTPGTIDGVNVYYINCKVETTDSDIKKIKYLFKVNKIKKIIRQINPDIINAHYASSYGMVAALCNINYILSVWGTDVYNFPKKSFLHRLYFKYLINKPKYIFSTSNSMAEELKKYTAKQIYVTPFGVKMNLFKPIINKKHKNEFIVGTIKALKEKYGINYIIDAIEIIKKNRPDINIKVRIAGVGDKENEYKKLAMKKNINVDWLGFISQEQAAKEWANMDVGLIPSLEESFGVAAIEAEACGIPIIVSNLPGLLETTIKESRIVIQKKDSHALANAIIYLYDNPSLIKKMGYKGRKYVKKKYEYDKCFKKIERIFMETQKQS